MAYMVLMAGPMTVDLSDPDAVLERFDDFELLVDQPRRVPFTMDEQIVALPVAVAMR
jgi:hypothetical protein